MTEDEQEALSCKYVMARVMRLSSGAVALFVGDKLTIFTNPYQVVDGLVDHLPRYDQLPSAKPREAKPARERLSLTDLIGL